MTICTTFLPHENILIYEKQNRKNTKLSHPHSFKEVFSIDTELTVYEIICNTKNNRCLMTKKQHPHWQLQGLRVIYNHYEFSHTNQMGKVILIII